MGYKTKTQYDSLIKPYKASHAAKGYSQEYSIDLEETFALVSQVIHLELL